MTRADYEAAIGRVHLEPGPNGTLIIPLFTEPGHLEASATLVPIGAKTSVAISEGSKGKGNVIKTEINNYLELI